MALLQQVPRGADSDDARAQNDDLHDTLLKEMRKSSLEYGKNLGVSEGELN
jgi:hypothetical protein